MTFSNQPTRIVAHWLAHDSGTAGFWRERAETWAAELEPEPARRRLAQELRQALCASRPEDATLGLWGRLTEDTLEAVSWNELAAHWIAETRQGAIWARLDNAPAAEPCVPAGTPRIECLDHSVLPPA